MKLRIKNTELILQLIGWLQLLGGISGLGLIVYLMLRTATINGPVLLIFCTGISLFIFSIYFGKNLIWAQDMTYAIVASIFNQFFQLFQWVIDGYGIFYSSGAAMSIGIHKSLIDFVFGASSTNSVCLSNRMMIFLLK